MLLLNKGMMQFIKHPFHRDGFRYSDGFAILGYSGGALTESEITAIRNSATTVSNTGVLPFRSITNTLLQNRISFNTTSAITLNHVTIARSGHILDGLAFPFSRTPDVLQCTNSCTLGLIRLCIFNEYGASGNEYLCCFMAFFTVGLPGSGADIELEKVDYVAGERIKINDIVINIENLLGEAYVET